VSNQLLLIHYILQSKQTDDKIFSKILIRDRC